MPIPLIKMITVGILPSFLKVPFYRMTGAKIGKNVSIGIFSVIQGKSVHIGDGSKIGSMSFISARKIDIGKRVKINMMVAIETGEFKIDNDCTIMEQVVIGGMMTPRSRISIGKNVKIFPYCFINPTEPIVIEDDAGIGGANYIFTHGSWQSELDGFPVGFGPVTIKKGAWFPWRVFVMPNVTVGEFATIGAGSILTKDIPAYSLAAGSPAKVLRTGDEYIKKFSDADKHLKICGYLSEFVEYMNYLGNPCKKIYEAENSFLITLQLKKRIIKIAYSFMSDDTEKAHITISYMPIDTELKSQILSENRSYFSISEQETFYKPIEEWTLVRDFFSRYGVRFHAVN